MRALLGAFDGRVKRFIEPVGGTIDRHPAQTTVGSGIHCCDLHYSFGAGHPAALLLQLVDASTLKVEARPGESATCPSIAARAFTAAAFTYVR